MCYKTGNHNVKPFYKHKRSILNQLNHVVNDKVGVAFYFLGFLLLHVSIMQE